MITPEEYKARHVELHKARHVELHKALDELIADFITHTKKLPTSTVLMELMRWSKEQTDNPTESVYD